MKSTFQLTTALTIITTIAGLSIGAAYLQTKGSITDQNGERFNSALTSIFPTGVAISRDSLTKDSGESVPFWIAKKSSAAGTSILGFAFESEKKGYSSIIHTLVAVTPDGQILGMKILSQQETPGLGTRCEEAVSDATFWTGLFAKQTKTEPWFQAQFRNISITKPIEITKKSEWYTLSGNSKSSMIANNEISAITGATITTKAVVSGLNEQANTIKEINDYLSSKTGGLL